MQKTKLLTPKCRLLLKADNRTVYLRILQLMWIQNIKYELKKHAVKPS
jgi:hypothetical protein